MDAAASVVRFKDSEGSAQFSARKFAEGESPIVLFSTETRSTRVHVEDKIVSKKLAHAYAAATRKE